MKYKAFVLSLVILAISVILIYQPPKENSEGNSVNNSSLNNAPRSSAQLIETAQNNKQAAWLLFHSTT